MLTIAVVARSQTNLEIEPRLAELGSFSAQNPAESTPNPGTTTIRITSDVPWSLQATLVQPARRVSDNLELPLERVRQYFSDLAEFCNYSPVKLDYGPADNRPQTIEYDWQLLQSRIGQYVDEADPPGTYRFSVRIELKDRAGQPLSAAVVAVVEFGILPYVAVELPNPKFVVTVEDPGQPVESDPFYVTVRSNTAWSLEMELTGNPVRDNTAQQIGRTHVMWLVGTGDEWESLIPVFSQIGPGSVLAARGNAPPPFTLTEVAIPFQLRVETNGDDLAGTYASDIRFGVHTDNAAR